MRRTCWSLRFLYNLESNGLHSGQGFITGLGNVRWWQEEAITPAVLELKREGVFDAEVVRPVVRATRSQVWRKEMTTVCVLTESSPANFCLKMNPTHILSLLQHHICTCFYNIFWFSGQLLGPSRAFKKSAFMHTHLERTIKNLCFVPTYRNGQVEWDTVVFCNNWQPSCTIKTPNTLELIA